jgi:hypothetical protein
VVDDRADYARLDRLRFAFHVGDGEWHWLAEQFDASILSDEAGRQGCRISPERLSDCAVRTTPVPHIRRTSTILNIPEREFSAAAPA